MRFGGFVGLDHGHYPIAWGALTYDHRFVVFEPISPSKQLRDVPELNDGSWQDRGWETRNHRYYGAPTYWNWEEQGGL